MPIIKRKVRRMIDTLDKKYGGKASNATTSTGVSAQIGVTPDKDEESTGGKKKVTKIKSKGIATTKPATYSKEKDLSTLVSSPSKDRPIGVNYTRKKKSDPKPKNDEKGGDITDTLSYVEIKEVRRSGRNKAPKIDELVHGIKEFGGLGRVGRRYSISNEEDKRKIEEALIWNLHNFFRTPSELYGIIPSDLLDHIEGRWKTTLATEKELRIKALMQVQHDLDLEEASLVAEACIQHFKIRNRSGRST